MAMKAVFSLVFLGAVWFSAVLAEEKMTSKNIVDLVPGELETVELSAVTDSPVMQAIAGENPVAGGLTSYQSSNGKLNVGFYHGSEVTLRISGWPVDEFMYFLEGQVEITNEDGSSKLYGPGDALVMPKGFKGTWRQLGPIKKINVSYPGE
ncbi:MAG: DUF861 domain-containing protein [Gammaproteobacteria bacterium]|nr:DUF861 domain-containing protein [Gammaproteobacteria bacterium]